MSDMHRAPDIAASDESPIEARDLFDLSGRVALVTGGTRGLGLAIARTFASAGADLVIASRNEAACAQIATEFESAGIRTLACACHVGRWDDIERLVDTAYGAFGRVDVLVNNAGIAPVYETLGGVSEELFDKTLAVNLKGPFRLTALVGERMVAGDGGSVINVSSTGAIRPTADIVPYAAAKAGLNAMTVGFADALGPTVRVNAIMPGPFLTTIANAWDMDVLGERTRTFPLRRAGIASEIAGAALYLASDASTYTTGSILTVDGGASWAMPGGGDAR
jgi:NAD(P)-dependent dehydrogenase (short-subunit alcohol dehydrogenase family)